MDYDDPNRLGCLDCGTSLIGRHGNMKLCLACSIARQNAHLRAKYAAKKAEREANR